MVERFFEAVGRIGARYRWPIILFWIALATVITITAPNLDDVTTSDVRDLLPAQAPFTQAEAILREEFPDQFARGSAVIVLETENIREEPAWSALADLTAWLESEDSPEHITQVTSPGGGLPLLADALISDDNRVALILLKFDTDPRSPGTVDALNSIRNYVETTLPDDVNVYFTGSSPIVVGYTDAIITSVDRTTGVTIALVVLMLLLVYRSPVSPVLPLLTVSISYLISRGITAWLAANVMVVSSYANVILIVVLFGAGTDYCLFLISRFREEMAGDHRTAPAVIRTVQRVGETITSSAGTVIVGFVTMAFAEMGLFRSTGPALALGVVVVLLAGLTLTPALLALMGERVFWPRRATHQEGGGRLYRRVSSLVSQRPVVVIVVIVLALSPLAAYAAGMRTSYAMMDDLPTDSEARIGYEVLEAHMGGGQMQPLSVVIRDLDPQNALAEIARWTEDIRAVEGVADVRSLSNPLGEANADLQGLTRIDRQLTLAADVLGQLGGEDGQITPERLNLARSALPFIQDYLTTLEERFPQVAGSEDLAAIRETINSLPAAILTGQLQQSLDALQSHLLSLADTFASIEDAYYLPESLPQELVDALGGEDPLVSITSLYLTPDRAAARLEVIVASNPFGDETMDTITRLRGILPGGATAVSGLPVSVTDLRDTMDRDTIRAFAIVLLGVFVVLVFLLRALVAPIYLILTILFSYGVTIGITRLVSPLLFHSDRLTWWVPFFMLVMLIALGMDYNIFLMGRVREEAGRYGVREGVHRAVIATGAIITSAGIIMAGTFSAMMSSVITGLQQLGFAVAIGVLLDTFVIRTTLVPAIAVLLGRWNWWPRRTPETASAGEAVPSGPRAHVPGD